MGNAARAPGSMTTTPSYVKVVHPESTYPITLTLEYYSHGNLSDSITLQGSNSSDKKFHGINCRYSNSYWIFTAQNSESYWRLRDGALDMAAMSPSTEESFVYSDHNVRLAFLNGIDRVDAGRIAAIFGDRNK